MKTIMLKFAAAAIAFTAIAGCITTPGVVQDKSKPMEQGKYTVVADSTSSQVWYVSIFGFSLPPIFDDSDSVTDLAGNMTSVQAGRILYKKAVAKVPEADALIEYTLDSQTLWGFFFYVGRYTLTGTPVKTQN